MKTTYLFCAAVAAAVLTLTATSCMNNDLDVLNKKIGGTVPIGGSDFALYVGKTDTFHMSKFIPDNEYLIIEDGEYRVYWKDSVQETVPAVDSVVFKISPDLDTNRLDVSGLKMGAFPPIAPIGGVVVPLSINLYDGQATDSNNESWSLADMKIPIKINNVGNQIAAIDTIFFTNTSIVKTTVDLTTFHSQLLSTSDERITLTITFSKGFKVVQETGDPGTVQGDTTYIVDNFKTSGQDSHLFNCKVVHFVTNSNDTSSFDGTIQYRIRYTNPPSQLKTCSYGCTAALGIGLTANLAIADAAITTQNNLPFEIERKAFPLDAKLNAPPEVERIDSVKMSKDRNDLWIAATTINFGPFKFSDYTKSNDYVAPNSGVDFGRIPLNYPNSIELKADKSDGIITSAQGNFYQPTINDLFGSPNLHIMGLNPPAPVTNIGHNNDKEIVNDSLVLWPTKVFLQQAHLRKSQLDSIQNNPPVILIGLKADVKVEKIIGAFNISQSQDQMNVSQSIDFSEMLSSLGKIETLKLAFAEEKTKVNLTLSNPTGLKLEVPVTITAYRKDKSTTKPQVLTANAATTPDHPAISTFQIDVYDILKDVPDSLSIKVAPHDNSKKLENQTIFMGTDAQPLNITYKLDIPIQFSDSFKIVYVDTIKVGAEIPKGITGCVGFFLGYSNTIPAELKLEIQALDEHNNKLDVDIDDTQLRLEPGNGPDEQPVGDILARDKDKLLRFNICEDPASPGNLAKMKSLRLRASLNGSSVGATKALSNKDYLIISVYLETKNLTVDLDK
ncbi:hypothetical protein FACS189452_02970 [Bacteroidia bacterium]|nr:hypothetical protein FACS189452_02970 [Bacteroidia bacterium]GHT81701.1 hypothetical protein FACS189467_6210 [Bacteroidia bacterium]